MTSRSDDRKRALELPVLARSVVAMILEVHCLMCQGIVKKMCSDDDEEEEAITSSSHIRLIRWTQPVSRNRSRNTHESQ